MIVQSHGFGISLTDEFGYAIYEDLVEAIRETYGYNYPEWIVDCPSVEETQLLLGFELYATKNTDYKAAEDKWHKLMARLPQDIKTLVEKAGLNNPDIEVMAGHC